MSEINYFKRKTLSGCVRWISLSAHILSLCVIFIISSSIYGQVSPYHNMEYSEYDGLISPTVHAIAQDRNGVMWFGTRKGLCTFDGLKWEAIKRESKIYQYGVLALEKDESGTLWAVAYNGGINLFTPESPHKPPIPPFQLEVSPNHLISSLAVRQTPKGIKAWFATAQGVIYYWNTASWNTINLSSLLGMKTRIFGIETFDGSVWVASNNGLYTVETGELRKVTRFDLPDEHIQGIKAGFEGKKLWLHGGTWCGFIGQNGFQLFYEHKEAYSDENQAIFIQPDYLGGIFIADHLKVHYIQVLENEDLKMIAVNQKGSFTFFMDREFSVWTAHRRGSSRLRLNHFSPIGGLLEAEVSAITEASRGKMIFGHPTGISIVENQEVKTISFKETRAKFGMVSRALDMVKDSQGDIWIAASYAGLARLDPQGNLTWYDESGLVCPVVSVALTHHGQLLVMPSHGPIMKREGDHFAPFVEPPGLRSKRRLVVAQDGTLLVCGLSEGLAVYEHDDWSYYHNKKGHPSNSVYAAIKSPRGSILVGTRAGLMEAKAGILTPVSRPGFSNSDPVYLLLEGPDNEIWLGTNNGLCVLSDSNIRSYGLEAGLPGLELNRGAGLIGSDGFLYFGTEKGAVIYEPQFAEILKHIPPPLIKVTLSSFSNQEQPFTMAENDVAYNDNSLFASFWAPSFLDPDQLLFRTRLLGIEEEWNEPLRHFRNQMRYANLNAGIYQFEVQVKNPGADWSPSVLSPVVTIHNPFWRRSWFQLLSIAILLSLCTLIIKYILKYQYASQLEKEVRKKKKQLEESQSEYIDLFNNSPIGIYRTTPAGKVIAANPALMDMIRVRDMNELSQLDLSNPSEYFAKYDRPAFQEKLGKEGEIVGWISTWIRKDGSQLHIRENAKLIVDEEGKPQYYDGTVEDISVEKQLEEHRLKSQKLESLALLAGGIAHDFNNMLTSILGNIHLTQFDTNEKDLKRRLKVLEKAVMRAQGLTKQLLTFSKGGKPVKQLCDLKTLILEAVHFASSGSSVQVTTSIEESNLTAECDPGQMTQVASNLTINAIQAMESNGTLHISIQYSNQELPQSLTPGKYILIEFSDTGHGISPNDLSRIYDPYYTTKDNGSGLGLATTHSIIQQHLGCIDVKSSIGNGSIFSVYIPASDQMIEVEDQSTFKSSVGKVLILDDDEMVLDVGLSILRALGCKTVGTTRGEETIDVFKKALEQGNPFQMVILDLTIPGGMGGKETMEHLVQLDPTIRGIVSSGYSNDNVMSNPQDYGFCDVLAKPYTLDQLKEIVNRQLNQC